MFDEIRKGLLKAAEEGLKGLQHVFNEKTDEAIESLQKSRVKSPVFFFESQEEKDEYDINHDLMRRSVMLDASNDRTN